MTGCICAPLRFIFFHSQFHSFPFLVLNISGVINFLCLCVLEGLSVYVCGSDEGGLVFVERP